MLGAFWQATFARMGIPGPPFSAAAAAACIVVPLRPALPLLSPGLQRHQHEMGGSQDARAWGEGGPWGCGSPRRLAGMRPPASCSVHGCKRRLPAAPALLPGGSQVSTHPDYKVTAFMDHTAMLTVQHPKYGEQGVQSAQSGRASQAPWASLGPGLGMAWNLESWEFVHFRELDAPSGSALSGCLAHPGCRPRPASMQGCLTASRWRCSGRGTRSTALTTPSCWVRWVPGRAGQLAGKERSRQFRQPEA